MSPTVGRTLSFGLSLLVANAGGVGAQGTAVNASGRIVAATPTGLLDVAQAAGGALAATPYSKSG